VDGTSSVGVATKRRQQRTVALRHTVTLAAHVFFDKIGKIHENTRKNITLRYLLIVVVIKYSLLNPRWRKPKVEVIQNRQLYMNSIL